MQKLVRYLFVFIWLVFALVIVDIFVFRGYFAVMTPFIGEHFSLGDEQSIDYSTDLEYQIDIQDDKVIVTWKNNSIEPKFIVLYRNDKLVFDLEDESLFRGLGRVKLEESQEDYSFYKFGCGTGLGLTLIKPYESFEYVFTKEEFLEDLTVDIKNILQEDNILRLQHSENSMVTLQFFTILHHYWSGKRIDAVSNPIEIDVKDIKFRFAEDFE